MLVSDRVRVRRGPKNAVYDRALIDRILDANLICHMAFTIEGEARVIPTAYLRIGDAVYLHGNRNNLMMNAVLDGQTACLSVMQLDGLVLARSGFHHSVNYHSVVLFGKAVAVDDADDVKVPILDAFIDKLVPGRAATLRAHTRKELNATLVVRIPIEEASAKVRTGAPVDDKEDYELDTWAGILPLNTTAGPVEVDPQLKAGVTLPYHLKKFS